MAYMKLTDKRFWMLVIVVASAAVASAQAVFSVEEISYFLSRPFFLHVFINIPYLFLIKKEYSRYNVIPADSIPDNKIVNMVLKESQKRFERLDSATRQEITYFDEGFEFNKQRLLYFPELKLYGFVIPDNTFDDTVWWFDAESGRYLCDTASPMAINANGIYVLQTGHDCDWPLELRFFRREGDEFYDR